MARPSRPAPWLRATVVVAAALILSGCAGDEPVPEPTAPVVTTTAEPEPVEPPVPEPEPEPTGLTRPEAMDRNDDEGAIAAAEYYAQLAFAIAITQDLAEWQAASTENCQFCASAAARVEQTRAEGNSVVGGATTLLDGTRIAGRDETIGVVGVDVPISVALMTVVGPDGQELESWPETELFFYTELAYGHEGWVIMTAGTFGYPH